VEALVDACLSKLAHHLDFSSIERNDFGVAFRQGWIDYLQYFGLGFDTSTYFVERMAFSSACARAGISLGLLHLQHSLVLQSVIELLAASEKPAQDLQLLTVHVLKLGALDAYLATEGHREARIDTPASLGESHEEVSRLHRSFDRPAYCLTNFSNLMEKLSNRSESRGGTTCAS
jgi:hypothetical protein